MGVRSQTGWANTSYTRQRHGKEGSEGQTISHTVIFKFFPNTNPLPLFHPAYPLHFTGSKNTMGRRAPWSKCCADVTLWYVALCVWQGLCFSAAPLSIPGWKQLFSLLHKADYRTDGETWFCMRTSTLSHANTGVTRVRGQPWLQGCIVGEAFDMFMKKCSALLV